MAQRFSVVTLLAFCFGVVLHISIGYANNHICEPPEPEERLHIYGNLSYTHRINTNNSKVQQLFDQGMTLAAGYNQLEARRAFRAALTFDKTCVMCWWGLTYARGPFQNKPGLPPPKDTNPAAIYYSKEDRNKAFLAITNAASLLGLVTLKNATAVAKASAAALRVHATTASSPAAAGKKPAASRLMSVLAGCRPPYGRSTTQSPPVTPLGRQARRRRHRRRQNQEQQQAGAVPSAPPPFPPDPPTPSVPGSPSTPAAPSPPPHAPSLSDMGRQRHYVAAMFDRLSVKAVYGPEWEAAERRFARDMQAIALCSPDDADAAALAAEAAANLRPWDFVDPDTGAPRNATRGVLRLIALALARNPQQPLALHLKIHATEVLPARRGADTAGEGEAAADALRSAAPATLDHLQHMPSHTYVRVGRWADAVESNVVALRASIRSSQHCLASLYPEHNAAMLVFAVSMAANMTRAHVYARVLREMPRFVRDATASLGYQWTAPLLVAVRAGEDWEGLLRAPPPPLYDDPRLAPLLPRRNGTTTGSSSTADPGSEGDGTAGVAVGGEEEGGDEGSWHAPGDVVKDPVLREVLVMDDGVSLVDKIRGRLDASEYAKDGAEYALVVWRFARLMAYAAKFDQARSIAGVSTHTSLFSPPPPASLPHGALTPSPAVNISVTDQAAAAAFEAAAGDQGLRAQGQSLGSGVAGGEGGVEGGEAAAEAVKLMTRYLNGMEMSYDLLKRAELLVSEDVATPPGPGLGTVVPGYKLLATVLRQMAEGRMALSRGNLTAAAELLSQAVGTEESGGFMEPPRLGPQPVRQCLGVVLLRQKRLKEAIQVYLDDLVRFPDNPWSLSGLRIALQDALKRVEQVEAGVGSEQGPQLSPEEIKQLKEVVHRAQEVMTENQAASRSLSSSCPAFATPRRQGERRLL